MNLLLSPTLRLILSSANLRTFHFTILHKRFPTNLDILFQSNLFILNEAAFPEVLLALLFLLGLIVGDIGGVAPLVIGVITLNNIIILSLLNHLYFVNTFLSISIRSSSSYSSKVHSNIFASLTGKPTIKGLRRLMCFMMVVMFMMIFCSSLGIKGERVDK